jgi:hypothetical protein
MDGDARYETRDAQSMLLTEWNGGVGEHGTALSALHNRACPAPVGNLNTLGLRQGYVNDSYNVN